MNSNLYKKILSFILLPFIALLSYADEAPLQVDINLQNGSISRLTIANDPSGMDWLVKTDGSQYPWVREKLSWGLGYFTLTRGHQSIKEEWERPAEINRDGTEVIYREDDIEIRVKRVVANGRLRERYTLTNKGKEAASLYDIGIYTPFNDNYPGAEECIRARTNVQVWDGGSAAYVNALRMGGTAPHLGLAVTEGAVKSYEIWERGARKGNSQYRGIFTLNLPDLYLKPDQSYTLAWELFSHQGNDDFRKKLLNLGSLLVSCEKYVYQQGETARMEIQTISTLEDCTALLNGVPVPVKQSNGRYVVETPLMQPGKVRLDFCYNHGKQTHADLLVTSSEKGLLEKRVEFIRTHQQMNRPDDPRYGAYMIYDNEGDSIYLNDTPNCNPVDRDEGAERVGMGVLLAKQYRLAPDTALKESLLKYAVFLREKLQTKDYVTYSSVDQTNRNRGYNYMWVADFYFQMYLATGDRHFATDGYETLQSMFRQFGYGFYAIGIPVQTGLESLKAAGMEHEYHKLLDDFRKTGDIFIRNSLNYPKFEVNYEQSIVAPAVQFLAQLYLVTREQKYLDEVERQLPVVEAFNGFQPSYHLNEVAIRHWDGYWFGKREMFGDTFPHYWSTVTAAVYHYYALCTGDQSYQKRAENIVRNNLCLFSEDGRASCAYLYPYKIDGMKGQFYDPYANDQDWALVYYLLVHKGI